MDMNLPQLYLPYLGSQTSTMASVDGIVCAAAALGATAAKTAVSAAVLAVIIDDHEDDSLDM